MKPGDIVSAYNLITPFSHGIVKEIRPSGIVVVEVEGKDKFIWIECLKKLKRRKQK